MDIYSNKRVLIDSDNPSLCRDESICRKCGLCKLVCNRDMAVDGYYDPAKTGNSAVCVNCGQCLQACPFGSLKIINDMPQFLAAIKNPNKKVACILAPAVRVAFGEMFGKAAGTNVAPKIVGLLKQMGVDFVFDTTFGADLTTMEEAAELVLRLKTKSKLPMFSSCCPAWVKYAETFLPNYLNNLSTCRSPIGMQSAIIKTYFAKQKGLLPNDLYVVAITPCIAKKFEILRPEMCKANEYFCLGSAKDTDCVITTVELAQETQKRNINFDEIKPKKFDQIVGNGSGLGLGFGASGGVAQSVLKTAYYLLNGTPAPQNLVELSPVEGNPALRRGKVNLGSKTVDVAAVYGTAKLKEFLILNQNNLPDFIEVMACPNGCVGGGGQPKCTPETLKARKMGILQSNKKQKITAAYQNPQIQELYATFLKKPLSKTSKELLHTTFVDRSLT